MTFQSGTDNRGTIQRKLKNAEKQCKELEKQNERLKKAIQRLQTKADEVANIDCDIDTILQQADDVSDVLGQYLRATFDNIFKKSSGNRYPNLDNFLALLSFFGRKQCSILHQTLMLPHFNTLISKRKAVLDKNDFTDMIFDGKIANIQKLMAINSIDNDIKAVLAIDAVHVQPYISVDDTGLITGLVNLPNDSKHIAKIILENEQEFEHFIRREQKSIINAIFVFQVQPLDGAYNSFPIYYKPAHSGTAKEDIHHEIIQIFYSLQKLGIHIKGLGTDGDAQYLIYSRTLVKYIFHKIDKFINKKLLKKLQSFQKLLHFSDPFHLVKRDRYKKVCNESFCCSPTYIDIVRRVTDLEEYGLSEYILCNDKSRKMEDDLAQKFFSIEVIQNILRKEDIPLLCAMLPSALLLNSLHSKELSRSQRIDELLFGVSIVLIYYICQNPDYQDFNHITTKQLSYYTLISCFSLQWCEEYISSALSIAYMLMTEKNLNLASCGTHLLEHFFGNIRRMSNGDDSLKTFTRTMQNVVIEGKLCQECGIDITKSSRRKDSGVIVSDDIEPQIYRLIDYLHKARMLLNNFVDFKKMWLPDGLLAVKETMSIDELNVLIPEVSKTKRTFFSTKKAKMTSTGGYSNIRRWKAADQLKMKYD